MVDTLMHAVELDEAERTESSSVIRNKIQLIAASNAYTLLFMSVLFVITWILMIVLKFT